MTVIMSDTWRVGFGYWKEYGLFELYFGSRIIYFAKEEDLP